MKFIRALESRLEISLIIHWFWNISQISEQEFGETEFLETWQSKNDATLYNKNLLPNLEVRYSGLHAQAVVSKTPNGFSPEIYPVTVTRTLLRSILQPFIELIRYFSSENAIPNKTFPIIIREQCFWKHPRWNPSYILLRNSDHVVKCSTMLVLVARLICEHDICNMYQLCCCLSLLFKLPWQIIVGT